MRKSLIGIALLTVAVLAFSVVGYVRAQPQWPPDPDSPYSRGWGMMYGGFGWMGNFDREGPIHDAMVSALAEALNIDPDKIEERHDSGEHLWEIALEEGMSKEEIQDLMQTVHESSLEEAVAEGWLTQEQADWMQEHMQWMWSGEGELNHYGSHCGGIGRYYEGTGW